MEFELNDSPELSMAEITKLLFNRNFLSDVQFLVADQTIYAHSFELMKRSIVFQQQLVDTWGENKCIPINDVGYDDVYKFIRFIYTDECVIDNTNAIGLLKLATRYKVIKLRNNIIRVISGVEMNLCLYEYCLLERDQFLVRRSHEVVMNNLGKCLVSKRFLKISPCVVDEILKSDHSNVSEFELFTAVARWIDQNSKDNQIEIEQQRNVYEILFHRIRFPVMSRGELIKCTTDYRHLFKDSDLAPFFRGITPDDCEQNLWNSDRRLLYPQKYDWNVNNGETKFTVTREMLFCGLCFGGSRHTQSAAELIITERNLVTHKTTMLKLDCGPRLDYTFHQINLGESIRVRPNMEYTVKFKWSKKFGYLILWSRINVDDISINVPQSLIQFTEVSKNMYDMYFQLID